MMEGWKTFDCHWKSMESWLGVGGNVGFCCGYNTEIYKEVFNILGSMEISTHANITYTSKI